MQGNLDVRIAMAQRLEVYHGGNGAKVGGSGGKGSKNMKKQKKANVADVEGSSSGGPSRRSSWLRNSS